METLKHLATNPAVIVGLIVLAAVLAAVLETRHPAVEELEPAPRWSMRSGLDTVHRSAWPTRQELHDAAVRRTGADPHRTPQARRYSAPR